MDPQLGVSGRAAILELQLGQDLRYHQGASHQGCQETRLPERQIQHLLGCHWMRHLEKQVIWREGIGWVIDEETIMHWQRQINSGYDDMTEGGKESDRHQADKILALLAE